MRDTSKDDKVSGRKNTYGFERGDILHVISRESLKPTDVVEVLRSWKYTCLLRSCISGREYKEYNWFLALAS